MTGVQTCALPILLAPGRADPGPGPRKVGPTREGQGQGQQKSAWPWPGPACGQCTFRPMSSWPALRYSEDSRNAVLPLDGSVATIHVSAVPGVSSPFPTGIYFLGQLYHNCLYWISNSAESAGSLFLVISS